MHQKLYIQMTNT